MISVRDRGWLKGMIAGVLSVLLSFLLFSLIGGEFSLTPFFLAEVLFGGIVGAIAGIVAVNLHR
jgi:putative membrane protein (TIGR04086 family)